jgi:hypothetical protein
VQLVEHEFDADFNVGRDVVLIRIVLDLEMTDGKGLLSRAGAGRAVDGVPGKARANRNA